MKSFYHYLIFFFFGLVSLSPSSSIATEQNASIDPSTFPRVLLDGANRTVKLTAPPTHIVSLSPAATDILLKAEGVREELVGVTRYCQIPPAEEKRIARVGGVLDPDYERIASLKPDLVVAPQLTDKTLLSKLTALGLTVIVLHPEGLQNILEDIRLLGKATGRDVAGEAAVKAIEATRTLTASRWRSTSAEARPRVLIRMGDVSPAPGSYVDDLITAAGGRNVIPRGPKTWVQISPESVLQLNPSLIVNIPSPDEPAGSTNLVAIAPAKATTATQAKTVTLTDGAIFYRPGPDVGQALWELGRTFYPQLFPEAKPPIGKIQSTRGYALP